MANQLATNPWELDTAASGTILFGGMIKLKSIVFKGYAVATDVAILHDRNGNVVAELHGHDDFSPVEAPSNDSWIHGLIFESLSPGSTGKVLVYFD